MIEHFNTIRILIFFVFYNSPSIFNLFFIFFKPI